MRNTTSVVLKEQGLFENFLPKKWEDPFPDFILEEKLSLKLVGFARALVKVSFFQKKYSLSLSDDYLCSLWGDNNNKISRSSVQRRLTELQKSGLFFISTSDPIKMPNGCFRQERTITLIPQAAKKKFSDRLVKNDTPIKNTSFGSIRTIQKKEKSLSNFIDTKSLKEIEPTKKQNPDKLVKRLQISFMKKAVDKIIENDDLDYRFICLFLRTCLGANEQTIKYYGSVLHFNLRFKPEIVISTLELMIKSYDGIRKPVGFFISELQSSLGKHNKKSLSVGPPSLAQTEIIDLIEEDKKSRKHEPKKRNLKELEEKFNRMKKERKERKTEPDKNKKTLPFNHKNSQKKDYGEIISLFKKRIE